MRNEISCRRDIFFFFLSLCEDLMRKLLQVKFAPGSEMAARLQASGTKLLAESGKDKFFSCGMSLTHPDILDSTKWKSNMLGKLQMEIRDKLNKS